MDRNAIILFLAYIITTLVTYFYITLSSEVDITPFVNIPYLGFAIICGFGATALIVEIIE